MIHSRSFPFNSLELRGTLNRASLVATWFREVWENSLDELVQGLPLGGRVKDTLGTTLNFNSFNISAQSLGAKAGCYPRYIALQLPQQNNLAMLSPVLFLWSTINFSKGRVLPLAAHFES